jgi:hypothetical protein
MPLKWPFGKKRVPDTPSTTGSTTVEKIQQLQALIETGKLSPPKRRVYQELLKKFLLLRDSELKAQATVKTKAQQIEAAVDDLKQSTTTTPGAQVDMAERKRDDAAKAHAYGILKTKIRTMRSKPVKKFACGKESALMLLGSGELYQWQDDNPLPLLMNDMFRLNPGDDAPSLAHKLNLKRFYWTEEELMRLDKDTLEQLKDDFGIVLHNKSDMLSRIIGLIELGTSNLPPKYRKIQVKDLEASKTSEIEVVARDLGLLGSTSTKFLVRAIVKRRSIVDPIITDIAAGQHHFIAATNITSYPVWSWGQNTFGQLGLGDNFDREFPEPVRTIQNRAVQVECGDYFSMVLTSGGTVFTWGKGDSGQLGHTVPRTTETVGDGENDQEVEGDLGGRNPRADHLQLVFEDINYPKRMNLASDFGEKLNLDSEEIDDAVPALHIAAGGTMAAAWSTRWPVVDDLNHFDRQALEGLKEELSEKMRRLGTAESIHGELERRFGDHRACPPHAELITCSTDRDKIKPGNPCCTNIGDRHVVEPRCFKCFGRGYHRDEKLQTIDSLIEKCRVDQKKSFKQFEAARNAIRSVEYELKSLVKELKETKNEKLALENLQTKLRKEMNEVKKNDNLTKQSKDEMIRRVQEELSSLDLQMERVRHHEKLCATSGDNTLGRLIGMKRSLVRVQKGYHADSSKLLLYRRLKIRRQKRLTWNMILLRDKHARRLIEKAHLIWKKIESADFGHLFRNTKEMNRLMIEYGRKSRDNLENAWIIKLSNHKLRALMKDATRQLGMEKIPSWRFEGHAIMGDVIRGWTEYDEKGRPVLYANYASDESTPGILQGGIESQNLYCHYFQFNECELPCPHGRVHEMLPPHVRQLALQRQGFKGVDVDCVDPGSSCMTLDTTTLVVSFFKYDEVDRNMVHKIRIYVDGEGPGQGVQQICGVIYTKRNDIPGRILPSAITMPTDVASGQKPGWINLSFPNPVSLPSFGREQAGGASGDEQRGLWIGFYAPHGQGVIRVYGTPIDSRTDRGNVCDFQAIKSLLLTAPPIEFPAHEPLLFRPSIYCETAGLWARLLAMLLDIAQLKMRINSLSLAMTHEKSEKRAMDSLKPRSANDGSFDVDAAVR